MGATCAAWRAARPACRGPEAPRCPPSPPPAPPGPDSDLSGVPAKESRLLSPAAGGRARGRGCGTSGVGCGRGRRRPRGALAAAGAPHPLPPAVRRLTLPPRPPAHSRRMNEGEKRLPPTPHPRPVSAVLEPVSPALGNFIKRNRGTASLLSPRLPPGPHPGDMISGFAPTRNPRPAARQPPGCIYLLNPRGQGSGGNGSESVTGGHKLKSPWLGPLMPLLVRPLRPPELKTGKRSRECPRT